MLLKNIYYPWFNNIVIYIDIETKCLKCIPSVILFTEYGSAQRCQGS